MRFSIDRPTFVAAIQARAPSRVGAHPGAVVGRRAVAGTIGHELFRNLLAYDFQGPVYPVNPTSVSVAGVRAYASILDVPDTVDVALVVVPADLVPGVVEECAQKQVFGVVIISAGFAETGTSGKDAERHRRDRAPQRHA